MQGAYLRSVNVDGLTIAYRHSGRGAALVLLHGFLSDSRCWRPQLANLSDRFQVLAWDAPGAGSSSDPPDSFTTIDFARSLANFLDAVGVDRAHVLGLSWGGILAQAFYRLHAGRVRSLVLADTYAGWRGSLPEVVWKDRLAGCLKDVDGPRDALVAKFLPGLFSAAVEPEVREEMAGIVSAFHPAGFRLMALSCAEEDTSNLLPNIDVPTLLIWGRDDSRSPPSIGEAFRVAIPGSELAVIANAGHVSNMEQPTAFNGHVRRFCLAMDGHKLASR